MSSPHSLLVIGASTRAAAMSTIRAGWKPICVDAFGDIDLLQRASVVHVPNYPRGIAKAVRQLPECPWIYTGGLENRPRLIEKLSATRRLWGNSADVLRRIRDPFRWTEILHRAELPTLAVRRFDNPPCLDGTWIRKPIRSAGGLRIDEWNHAKPTSHQFFFQERAEGDSFSATILSAATADGCDVRLVGIVRHFTDHRGLHANRFGWCGGITQADFSDSASDQITRIARVLAGECGLKGICGIDFLWDGGTVWPVEINPRYTATGELWDAVHDRSLIRDHIDACKGTIRHVKETNTPTVAAKVVVYAPKSLRIPKVFPSLAVPMVTDNEPFQLPPFADIPHADTEIPVGWPVCTVLANAHSKSNTLTLLQERLAWLSEQFQRDGQNIAWRCQF